MQANFLVVEYFGGLKLVPFMRSFLGDEGSQILKYRRSCSRSRHFWWQPTNQPNLLDASCCNTSIMTRSKQSTKCRKGGADRHNNNNTSNKRRKIVKKFWIEDCPNTKPPEDTSDGVVFDVMITRVELSDDYKQVSEASRAMESTNVPDESADGKTQVASEVGIELLNDSNTVQPEEKDPSTILINSASAEKQDPHKDDLCEKKNNGDPAKDTSTDPATESSAGDDLGEKDKPVVRPYIVVKRTTSAKGRLRHVSPYPYDRVGSQLHHLTPSLQIGI